MARRCEIRIGTSGWTYDHWAGPVYPEDMPKEDYLAHYARSLDTVEVNSTFYGLPSEASVRSWRDAAPAGFLFAVKASRYITHMKKLKDPRDSVARFLEAIRPFGDRLGPILFQLPPRWRCNPERLDAFLNALPSGHRHAFEFRDASWHGEEVRDILERRGAAFCIFDLAGTVSPCMTTANFAYVRLHGPDGPYRGRYDGRTLKQWADRFLDWRAGGLDVYCYFDNDEAGYAFENAVQLRRLIDGS